MYADYWELHQYKDINDDYEPPSDEDDWENVPVYFECSRCHQSYEWNSFSPLPQLLKHHPDEPQRGYVCRYCELAFLNELFAQSGTAEPLTTLEGLDNRDEPWESYDCNIHSCWYCDKNFSKSDLFLKIGNYIWPGIRQFCFECAHLQSQTFFGHYLKHLNVYFNYYPFPIIIEEHIMEEIKPLNPATIPLLKRTAIDHFFVLTTEPQWQLIPIPFDYVLTRLRKNLTFYYKIPTFYLRFFRDRLITEISQLSAPKSQIDKIINDLLQNSTIMHSQIML